MLAYRKNGEERQRRRKIYLMPNYCENELYIKGPASFRQELKELVQTEERLLDFDRIAPYPEEWRRGDEIWNEWWEKYHSSPEGERESLKPEPKNYYNDLGYEWVIEHWGTKWNSIDPVVDHNSKRTVYGFSTAWSPPIPLVLTMSLLFPELTFKLKYWECGCAFKGIYECKNGEVIEDSSSNYYGNRGG